MYHVLRWNQLDPDEQRLAEAAEHALRQVSAGTELPAAADSALYELRKLAGYRVMTGGQMRGIRAAMGWLGMGERQRHGRHDGQQAGQHDVRPEAYALPQPWPQLSARPVPFRGAEPSAPPGIEALTHDATQRRELRKRELALDGYGGGLPLRTLTIPGVTWDVTGTSCAAALTRWRTALKDWRGHSAILYDVCGLTTESRRRTWLSWIIFLGGAATHAGLHAEGVRHPLNCLGRHTNDRAAYT